MINNFLTLLPDGMQGHEQWLVEVKHVVLSPAQDTEKNDGINLTW